MKLNIQRFAYTKTEWKDLPDETTPVIANTLNNIENGVTENDTRSTQNVIDISNLLTALGLLVDTWVSGTSYAVGDQEVYNGINYECTTANSDTTFTPSHWKVIPLLVPDDDTSSAKENIISEEE